MPKTAKNLSVLFLLLTGVFLGIDVYHWYTAMDGRPFSFADLGFLSKTYFPEEHQVAVDTLTPEIFNAVLSPILKISGVYLFGGLAALSLAGGMVAKIIGNRMPGQRGPKKPTAFKYNRR